MGYPNHPIYPLRRTLWASPFAVPATLQAAQRGASCGGPWEAPRHARRAGGKAKCIRHLFALQAGLESPGMGILARVLARMVGVAGVHAGWVVSGENKVKGQHQPLVSQELFDAVQDALDGKVAAPVVHKKLNDDFPLKGFIRCTGCDKKLTAGWVKGRKEKYPRYWCWNVKCPVRVSASRDEVENGFVGILGMMEPTQELLNRLPEIAKAYWANRLERITSERRRLSNRLAEVRTLNQRILLQKVNDELSAEDFATLKESVTQQQAEVEAQLNVLDAETTTMQGLLEET